MRMMPGLPSFMRNAVCIAALLLLQIGLPCAAQSDAWTYEVVRNDLRYPWEIQRDGNRLFITEVRGHIVTVEGSRFERRAVETTDAVVHDGGSGLLGMALAPDFQTSGRAYLYHTYRTGPSLFNKVIEVRHSGGRWQEARVLLAGIPGHQLYNGGRVAIGPDRHLYVTTGWVRDPVAAPDLSNLAGKVLRLRLDGTVPSDNPFPGSYVWSYGHRNPQGLAWSPDERLFVVEHGESGHDEINVVQPGMNHGWPHAVGTGHRHPIVSPIADSGSRTWAPSGAAFFEGRLLLAALGTRSLLAWDERSRTVTEMFSVEQRLRSVLPANGALYVITTNTSPRATRPEGQDSLLRLTRKP